MNECGGSRDWACGVNLIKLCFPLSHVYFFVGGEPKSIDKLDGGLWPDLIPLDQSLHGWCLEFDLRFKTPPMAIFFALSSLSFAILDCLISRLCCLFNLRCSFSFCFSISFLCLFHLHLKCFLCS